MITAGSIILASLVAFGASFGLHTAALRRFPKAGLLDFPRRYALERDPIPYPTGILSVSLFLLLFALVQPLLPSPWSTQNLGIGTSILLLGCTSFIDDREQLSPKVRLVVQILCALIIFATGTRIYSLTNPLETFTGIERLQLDTLVIPSPLLSDPSVIGALFTVLWLGLTMNALNWFDGVTGQVSVLAVIGFSTIGFLSLSARVNQPELALMSFLIAGIALGGLFFDFPPARVLMGDTGAMFFGLMLGVLTIYAGGKVATAFLVLGVPLIDFVMVIGRRMMKHSPIMQGGDDEHLHHRLLRKGWSQRRIIVLTALLGSIFGISALFLTTALKFISAVILLCIMAGLSRYAGKRTLVLLGCVLLLSSCSWSIGRETNTETIPPAPVIDRGVPDDVPLYDEDSDAKRMGYEVDATGEITVTMETINGILSPITYYRRVAEAGWEIVQDTQNNGGTLMATKDGRKLTVTFQELPGGAGTTIVLVTRP